MLLFDYLKDIYDAFLPYFYISGIILMGASLLTLIGYVWYFHGGNQGITEALALLLVLGGVMYQMGKRYQVVGRDDEARYDESAFE